MICFNIKISFRARLPSKFRKTATMSKESGFFATIQYGYQKTKNFILILNPLKNVHEKAIYYFVLKF